MTSRPINVTLHPLRAPAVTVKTQASSGPVALRVAFAAARRDRLLPAGSRIARVSYSDPVAEAEATADPAAIHRAINGSGCVWAHDRKPG